MIQKLKQHLLLLAATLVLTVPALVPVSAIADDCGASDTAGDIANGVNDATGANNDKNSSDTKVGCGSANVSTSQIGKAAHTIVQLFSIVVGVVAIIMIIYGGFRYITSGGDAGRVGGAKNTLIYAIVGLVIVALAQLIVHFVLNQSTNITTTTPPPAAATPTGG